MKRIILVIAIVLNLQLISCQQNTKTKPVNKFSEKLVTDNFFKEFKTIYGDSGLLQTGNIDIKKGGYEIYLISKEGANNWFDNLNEKGKYEATLKKINNSQPKEISKDFDIWVFYTSKDYITELEDESLGNKVPSIVRLYYLKAASNKWIEIENYDIKNEDDKIKFNDWKQKKLEELLNNSNKHTYLVKRPSSKFSKKWTGIYSCYFSYGEIGGEEAGWNLKLEVFEDSIKASGEGYQIGFCDLLNAEENNHTLVLNHHKNLSGYSLGKKMNPEFILIEDQGKYYIKSNWIDKDILTKPEKLGFRTEKE